MRYIRCEDGEQIEVGCRSLEEDELLIANADGYGACDIFIQAVGHITWKQLDALKAAIQEAERLWRK